MFFSLLIQLKREIVFRLFQIISSGQRMIIFDFIRFTNIFVWFSKIKWLHMILDKFIKTEYSKQNLIRRSPMHVISTDAFVFWNSVVAQADLSLTFHARRTFATEDDENQCLIKTQCCYQLCRLSSSIALSTLSADTTVWFRRSTFVQDRISSLILIHRIR